METTSSETNRDNNYMWKEYRTPRWPLLFLMDGSNDDSDDSATKSTLMLRHLKQGATGAVKTWPVAEILLTYLVEYGGLLQPYPPLEDSHPVLDLTMPPPSPQELQQQQQRTKLGESFHVVELGAGTGYLGMGLAMAFTAPPANTTNGNKEGCKQQQHELNSTSSSANPPRQKMKVLCTDMDKPTIKNMRHNITHNHMTKTVRPCPLTWSENCWEEPKFLQTLQSFFIPINNNNPLQSITHVIGSDVHYGETTLEPLSSCVATIKQRHPDVNIILMGRERGVDSFEHLKAKIEEKLKACGIINVSVMMRNVRHSLQERHDEFEMTQGVKILEF